MVRAPDSVVLLVIVLIIDFLCKSVNILNHGIKMVIPYLVMQYLPVINWLDFYPPNHPFINIEHQHTRLQQSRVCSAVPRHQANPRVKISTVDIFYTTMGLFKPQKLINFMIRLPQLFFVNIYIPYFF